VWVPATRPFFVAECAVRVAPPDGVGGSKGTADAALDWYMVAA
jgi:hypothetical protein